ncbi:2-C-methyl-D-erythritol 2,4-cyclodiphosphate synthase [Erysipelotrichaceae bacterium OH741_COT-311]|nr:2-C-methyl-D-erythritol 2,4-cyclodiphosphate synthase [Erysipelotrichaceae bacterium]MDO5084824.1 2-C-methyl-D-erythritol 2,4-cyclodiphosphate synthase [Erysipelotrichaceae bacterium]RRC92475.1 2-C-methyl-D-erythritol 2,4-cyclodiphosphate synthase [Erysipelotrichaceae bacterium OH741_COT-311]
MYRIGQSSDIHQLVMGRELILGGVNIPYEKGLLGHSDADALLHAIAEAMLGALALGDLGKHFPDTGMQYKGASSLMILNECGKMIRQRGYQVVNIDSLIMIERPKMAPYIDEMRRNIAKELHLSLDQVNVKATRGEGLGFVGQELGVLAQAVVLLEKQEGHFRLK